MSLVIGLVGGGLGGYAVNKWADDHPDSESSGQGLSDSDVVTDAPLPSNSEGTGSKDAASGSIADVAEVLLPSTVQILAEFNGEEGGATGSGFFLDKQGHVVTNNHVVAEAADGGKITVVDHQGKRYPATVVGRSPVYDLAVLDVEGITSVQPASLGSSKDLEVGEQVVAIGSPLGLSSTVTSGIVSALNRPVTTGGGEDSQSFINAVQTDAAINPGNSGGPLVNLSGQVVGVNSAIATTGGSSLGGESGNIGVGFAIPIEQVRVTADQILRDGEARYPVIGATVQSDQDGGGARIQEVVGDSPAADSGLKKGDLITALDDRPVTDNATLIVAIRSHLPGDTVTLTVDRDGDTKKVDVELDSKVG
ncbi:PDZ domain-containing protein [Nocardioides sp. JQ2195]|uniref:S1C family serine protease n=1 Tax=Nocardioides sp. JQ2195 TaxID=2592334 RepID=UPI00143E9C7C|nr:trypsin-like peptidase domain-containing protein [Nocardioides sp. JQ2195]QIX27676.1 PDZ domain-containing protein [Nocardioides sp. JQ2195]